MIYKVAPIDEDHKFMGDDVYVKVYNMYNKERREFEMKPDVTFEQFEHHIQERYRLKFPLMQYDNDSGDRITIDSEYSYDKALRTSENRSIHERLDLITLEIYVDEKDGYIYTCRRCRKDFLSDDRFSPEY